MGEVAQPAARNMKFDEEADGLNRQSDVLDDMKALDLVRNMQLHVGK